MITSSLPATSTSELPSSSPTEQLSWNLITYKTGEASSHDGVSMALSDDGVVVVYSKSGFNNISSTIRFIVTPSMPSSDNLSTSDDELPSLVAVYYFC